MATDCGAVSPEIDEIPGDEIRLIVVLGLGLWRIREVLGLSFSTNAARNICQLRKLNVARQSPDKGSHFGELGNRSVHES